MKKILLICIFVFLLNGCSRKANSVTEAEKLDELMLEKVVAYDMRSLELCEAGHIKGFICVDYGSSMDPKEQVIYNITNKYSQYKKRDLILLIGQNTDEALEVAQQLSKKGFRKVYYFIGGYDEYVKQKGEEYIPEVGCGC